MIVDFKVFDVGIQKALYVNTFSCDWFGKSIIGKKKNRKKNNNNNKQQTMKTKNKRSLYKQKKEKRTPTSLMIL